MKILSVLGSPRRKGSTSLALAEYLRAIKENTENQVDEVFLADMNIHGCTECLGCRRNGGTCVIKDDMQVLYEKLDSADLIIIATPVFWFNMTAQTKAFIDRWFAVYEKSLAGKKLSLISTFGDSNHKTSGYTILEDSIKTICNFIGMELVHSYAFSAEEFDNPNLNNRLAELYKLGKEI